GRSLMPQHGDLPPTQIAVSTLKNGQTATPANENLRLVVNSRDGGGANVVEVPGVDSSRMNEALFGDWSQNVPPEMKRLPDQPGPQVVRQRQLVPVELRDGRRVVVPVDQVQITPVGAKQFQ